MPGYNTNLAAEFYALSMLHRLGADANLTLGNKKSVDIAVIRGKGDSVTIDVKGLEGKTGWPVDNVGPGKSKHFLVFVCFQGKIDDPVVTPLVWVVPSLKLARLMYHAPGGRKLVTVSTLNKHGAKYKDAWKALL
jgi:hypothetical protein